MRRKDREKTGTDEKLEIIAKCKMQGLQDWII
jgi:hypothetical protein